MRSLNFLHGSVASLIQTFLRGTAAILVAGAVLFAGTLITSSSSHAQPADPCPNNLLPSPGTGQDIVISHECHVGDGTYTYGNINVVSTFAGDGKFITRGSLIFDELVPNVKINLYAKSILVEYGGSLLAGAQTAAGAFGAKGGVLTIHLYGAESANRAHGQGVPCQSIPISGVVGPCGIPNAVVTAGATGASVNLPGGPLGTQYTDNFYEYKNLPYDDGTNPSLGYFGYKVIGVSEGGTLKLFGSKGATYTSLAPKMTGTSWVRLKGTILGSDPGGATAATSLTIDGTVDWKQGDHIVLTTTDYLAGHSEELVICSLTSGNTISFDSNLNPATNCLASKTATGVKWTHYGNQYTLPAVNPTGRTVAETRAAVGLLTRSIQIVSEGDTATQPFPAPPAPNTVPGYFFGGHTIVRQGFSAYQVQGVEFRHMGQGGKLGHYPVHFHMVRVTPANTFVMDSSINESMTRWITVHGASGVTLQRNVGYLSIGHGFYLEDAVETENNFYSNLGVFARAAVINAQNPRQVPGILASPNETGAFSVKFESDKNTPAVFWITNGWNDFQGNMAAGAGMCGVCFWELPAANSGPSASQSWQFYATEQNCNGPADGCKVTGSTPLKNFDGNFCTSAMVSFQTVGYTQGCLGAVAPNYVVTPVVNTLAPKSTDAPLNSYYPNIDSGGQLQQASKCPDGACNTNLCDNSNPDHTNCLPTVINNYTTSFNYAQYNFAAVWLRKRWHLVSNSFISDVQNAGLSFISGGDYTHSSAIMGLWELALKTTFVGHTQPQGDANYAYASDLSPFNSLTAGKLKCDSPQLGGLYCVSKDNGLSLQLSNFGVSQHMFNIYDGPADEDSNAFLDIKKVDLNGTTIPTWLVSQFNVGIPQASLVDPNNKIPVKNCYIQNAAIAWKQPNGFYYPPTFHSNNLLFHNVDIRHYVIDPQFANMATPPITNIFGTYLTNTGEVQSRYCPPQNANTNYFLGYTGIDRQTVLTDDDGSLTGWVKTVSVNEDPFFHTPIDGVECQTDAATKEGGTARANPYENVTTVIYPDAAQKSAPPVKGQPVSCSASGPDPNWDGDCNNESCFGVPLYREYLTKSDLVKGVRPPTSSMPMIRMSGFGICQRQSMTVNNGRYFIDLTADFTTQESWPTPVGGKRLKSVFQGGKTYDIFDIYAQADTSQTFEMYIGTKTAPTVKSARVNLSSVPLKITADTKNLCSPTGAACKSVYDAGTGILSVTLNMRAYVTDAADPFMKAQIALCGPPGFCTYDTKHRACVGVTKSPTVPVVGRELSDPERTTTCGYAGKDADCPDGGCIGVQVTLPDTFTAANQVVQQDLPSKRSLCFPNTAVWNKPPAAASPTLAGTCVGANAPMNKAGDFCTLPALLGSRGD